MTAPEGKHSWSVVIPHATARAPVKEILFQSQREKSSGDMILNKFLNQPASSKRDEVCFRASIKVSSMFCIKSRHLLIDYPLLSCIPCLQKGM